MARTYEMKLSVRSIDKMINQIKKERVRLVLRQSQLVMRACKMGKILALINANILGITPPGTSGNGTGNLVAGIKYKHQPNILTVTGSIYVKAPYAAYVEYGWGMTGASDSHPNPFSSNGMWIYDLLGKGLTGFGSRPFLYNTARSLEILIPIAAEEVFSK